MTMGYLFAAFAVVWIAYFIYNGMLIRKTGQLEQEVRRLRELLAGRRAKPVE